MNRRETSRRRNREALLTAARAVFLEIGYDAGSVRDIIGRSGLALGTFYNYFEDKEAILRAVLEENASRMRVKFRAARASARSFPEFCEIEFSLFFHEVVEDRGTFELLRRNAAVIRELFDRPAIAAGLSDIREDLDRMIAEGLVAPMDTTLVAGVMWALSLELASRMAQREPADPAGMTAFAVQFFLHGLPWRQPGA
jgi:AcrR family transcriptional regulator